MKKITLTINDGRFKKGHLKIGNCGRPKGGIPWNKGKTKEECPQLTNGDKGFKKGIIPWNKGTKGIVTAWNKGKSMVHSGSFKRGHKLGLKDGRTPLAKMIRSLEEHRQWTINVFKRDNFTCQECGQIRGNIEAHHKKPFKIILQEFLNKYSMLSPMEDKETLTRISLSHKEFFDINNGETLCLNCHKKTESFSRKLQ